MGVCKAHLHQTYKPCVIGAIALHVQVYMNVSQDSLLFFHTVVFQNKINFHCKT